MYDVLVLKKKNYDHYINFIEKFDRSLIYHSIMFKNILEDLLNAESNYLICMKKKEILAVLPLIKITKNPISFKTKNAKTKTAQNTGWPETAFRMT